MTNRLPLEGVRCVELCWVWSGPMMGQYLADLGAEVIKVEWHKRYDLYRTRGVERLRGLIPETVRCELSFSFHSLNRGKLGATADLKSEAGLDYLKAIIAESDVLLENFTAGTLEGLGLTPQVLEATNPNLVLVSLSASGKGSGVEALRAYGLLLSALGGIESKFVDESDDFLGSPTFVVSDPNAAVFGAFAAIAGVLHARNTGRGVALECSQIEAMTTLAELERDERPENSHIMVTSSSDDYVAVTVPAGHPLDPADNDHLAQKGQELDTDELVRFAQDSGLMAAPVRRLMETLTSAEFEGTDVRIPTLHPIAGAEHLVAAPWREDGRRPVIRKPAPVLGEANQYIMRKVLRWDNWQIEELIASGAVTPPATDE